MGTSVQEISTLLALHLPRHGGHPIRVLDIGAQNLVSSSEEEINSFVTRAGGNVEDIDIYAAAMAAGAMSYPWGSINGAWLGNLLTRARIEYTAYDIFPGPWTTIFDLNTQECPPEFRGSYDIVLNCGTTEHVINQYKVYNTIHEACRVGGMMYHAVPLIGFLNDGYFAYTPAFFYDLARANSYELLDLRFRGPGPSKPVVEMLGELGISTSETIANPADWGGICVSDALIAVTFRRTNPETFRPPLLTRATVGSVADPIRVAYGLPQPADGGRDIESELQGVPPDIGTAVRAILRRFDDTTFEGIPVAALAAFLQLDALVAAEPQRTDLQEQLSAAETILADKWQLFRLARRPEAWHDRFGENVAATAATSEHASPRRRLERALADFNAHLERGRLDEYPLVLELDALRYGSAILYPDDWRLTKSLALCAEKLINSLQHAGRTAAVGDAGSSANDRDAGGSRDPGRG